MTASRILVASHAHFSEVIGGSFRIATEFAEHLASQGHDVSFVCCSSDGRNRPAEETINGVEVHRYLAPPERANGINRLRYHVRMTRQIVRKLITLGPVGFLTGHSPLQALGAVQALKGLKTRVNYTVHSPFDDELLSNSAARRKSLGLRLATLAARYVDRINCSRAHQVQTLSRYTMEVLQQKHPKANISAKEVIAPGWVQLRKQTLVKHRVAVRANLTDPWNTTLPLFFTLRRLENRMGLETLVKACRMLKDRGLGFRTLIGGSGSLRQNLLDQISAGDLSNEVFLIGRLSEHDLSNAYAAADCFVLPTRALECFGLIVLEAFAGSTPVIASNVAAIPELAGKQGDGWMFEPGNSTQLADRMQAFLEKRLQPTVDLRAIAMEYDKPKILKEWERILLGSSVQ